MGCEMNYWKCKFNAYEFEYDDEGGEVRFYYCDCELGDGYCHLNNKYNGDKEFCNIAEKIS